MTQAKIAAGAAAVMIAMGGGSAAAQAPVWTIQPTPGTAAGSLDGVSCPVDTGCAAVGATQATPPALWNTLGEGWNGSQWAIAPTPSPDTSYNAMNVLDGVSCPTTTLCVSVGSAGTALAEVWDGTSITAFTAPKSSQPISVTSVSCPDATECTAVGRGDAVHLSSSGVTVRSVPVVPATPPAASTSILASVSCTSASACMAVGSTATGSCTPFGCGSSAAALAERWDGTSWTIEPTPGLPTGTAELYGVSCTSANACMAVGSTNGSTVVPFASAWNGTNWTPVPVATVGRGSGLNAVSCTSATDCIAVGEGIGGAGQATTLAEHWDGSAWTVQTTPNPQAGPNGSQLTAVSCSSAQACTATGWYYGLAPNYASTFPLVERYAPLTSGAARSGARIHFFRCMNAVRRGPRALVRGLRKARGARAGGRVLAKSPCGRAKRSGA